MGKNCIALYGDGCLTLVALESISPGQRIYYGTLRCHTFPSKDNLPRQRLPWFLQQISSYSAALSFPPRGVTGISCYCFEYNLHLIKITSHLNRESIRCHFSYGVGVSCRCELIFAIYIFISANSTWSYSLQWWVQIWLLFANTVWWSQWLWAPFSYHRSKQMPSKLCMQYLVRTAYLLWQLLHASKPLVYTLYNAWVELVM